MSGFRSQVYVRIAAALFIGFAAGCGGGGTAPPAAPSNQTVTSSGNAVSPSAPTSGATALPAVAAGPGEVPSMADAFVDSIGINVHLGYAATMYGQFSATQSLLTNLGVRHYRDGAYTGNASMSREFRALGAAGLKADLLATEGEDVPALTSWLVSLGPAVDSVEGPDEFDLANVPSWWLQLDAFQSALYASVKTATTLPVIGPSFANATSFGLAGPFTGVADEGNMHDYSAGRNPGNGGWGPRDTFGIYRSLAWNVGIAAQLTPGKPMVSTETGYSDSTDTGAVPAVTKEHYVLRTLLEHWNAHVVRTYLYELIDEGTSPFAHYGLVDASGAPKPAYAALAGMIAHVRDPGVPFTVTPLSYGVTGTVHHTLLQRRNGTYALILWVEQSEWDVNAQTPLSLAQQNVTVSLSVTPHAASATTFSDTGSTATRALAPAAHLSLVVDGSPTVLDITP